MEVLPQIKTAILTCKNRKPIQFQPKRFRMPFSVSCSQSNLIPASLQDEDGQILNSDWRAFRAKLVASERTVTEKKPSLMANPNPVEDKWAHIIPEPEKGCLLVATEKLDGSHIYKRTVILLLSAGKMGYMGLILNRPSFMSTKENRPLFFGGPLFEGLFLVNTENGANQIGVYDEVVKGLYYGAIESLDCEDEVNRDLGEIGDFRFFDGYCSWEREELKDEMRAGYWTVAACSPNVIGLNGDVSVGLWEKVNELMGRRKVC